MRADCPGTWRQFESDICLSDQMLELIQMYQAVSAIRLYLCICRSADQQIHNLYWNIENTLINLVVIFVGGSDEHSPLLHTAQPYPGRSPDYWVRIFRPRPGSVLYSLTLTARKQPTLAHSVETIAPLPGSTTRGRW